MTTRSKQLVFAIQLLALAVIYYAVAKLGLSLASINSSVSPVWPPTGLAIGAVVLLGTRIWPAILLGAFLANAHLTDVHITTAGGIAIGNTLEALSAGLLLNYLGFHKSFDRVGDVWRFLAASLLCPMLSATVGNLSLCLGHAARWAEFSELWLTWWLGDSVGALVIAPVLFVWGSRWHLLPAKRYFEAAILMALLFLAAKSTFGGAIQIPLHLYPLARLMVPFFIWAAFRFRLRGVTAVTLFLSTVAVWETTQGVGPFIGPTANESLLRLQLFLGSNAIMFLFLAAIVEERRLAGETLRAKESQLNLIAQNTPVLLTQCSRDLRYQFVNRAYAEMLGLAPEELVGKSLVEIVGPEAFESVRPYVETVLEGQPVEFEAEVPYKRIGLRSLRVALTPDKDRNGNVRGWIASSTDVTERKRVEQALEQSDAQLRVALEAANLGAWEYDIRSGAIKWSRNLEILHGIEPGSFGGSFNDYLKDIHPDDSERVINSLTRSIESGSEHQIEYRIIRPDGSLRWVEGKGQVFRDPSGKAMLMSGVCMDITARKQVEEERANLLAREHEARVAAEQTSQMKDEFLATVSHELRTPLNAIVGWCGMLRAGHLDAATASRAIEIVDRNARVQTQLIEDLLDVSRIITGKLRLDVGPVQLVQIIEAAVDSIRPAATSKGITIELELDSKTGPVSGDANRLQQVVWNLLSNGVKFTPSNGRLQVKLQNNSSDAEIIVTDNGQGISPQFLPYVFDRFRQADGGITRKYGGLGLGLAIVRHLVELHGGSIKVESGGEGLGATFKVRLPLLIGRLGASNQVERQVANRLSADVQVQLNNLRVLVVDDEPETQELLTAILSEYGAEVKSADSAPEALSLLAAWQPDLLVSDIQMPDVDGYTFIRQVRALESTTIARIPAVAVTAYARGEDRAQALEAGFQIHVSKPVEPDELVMVVAGLTGRLGKQTAAQSHPVA